MLAKGRSRKGERHGRAKLTDEKVVAILGSPESDADLARQFGVTTPTIVAVKQRKIWRHLRDSDGEPYEAVPLVYASRSTGKRKLTPENVRDIRADGRLHREIAADYGIARNMVGRIKAGNRWGKIE
jgi:hypothetical protein